MIAENVTPFKMKHHPVPITPTSTAPTAGPKMRDDVITAVFSDVAFGISAGSTSSVTRLRRAGLSKAFAMPRNSDIAYTSGRLMTPVRSSTPSRSAWLAIADWVMIAIFRLFSRSAIAPA